MPSESAHASLVLHNVDVLGSLCERKGHHDWVSVVAFYTALHAVEALFARQKPDGRAHGQSHENREHLLKSDHRYSNLYKHYRPLQGIATVARYLEDNRGRVGKKVPHGIACFDDYMSEADVRNEVIAHRLNQVLRTASRLLRKEEGAKRSSAALEEANRRLKNIPESR